MMEEEKDEYDEMCNTAIAAFFVHKAVTHPSTDVARRCLTWVKTASFEALFLRPTKRWPRGSGSETGYVISSISDSFSDT